MAFQTSFGIYKRIVLPLDLCNAPAMFLRLMHDIFLPSWHDFVIVYLGKILIFFQDQAKHLDHITFVLEQLRKHGLQAKNKKTEFCQDQVEYLGHIVQKGTVHTDSSKVAAIAEQPAPTNIKQLQSFLGLANYYNRFIYRFTHIAAPLMVPLQKNVPFIWGLQWQHAFEELRVPLTITLVLQMLNFEYDFVLETDARAFAIGTALIQDKGDGLQPIAYFSKKLSDPETQYALHEVELLAIVSAFENFCPYMECRYTTAKTDHKPLIHVKTQPYLSNRQIRWA